MPVVTVYGVPQNAEPLIINCYLRPGLKKAIAEIAELCIFPKQVSVFLHQENTEDSGFAASQNDIVLFIDLNEGVQRTEDVLNRVCRAVVEKIKEFDFAKRALVECFCRPLSPTKGFWSSEM